MTMASKQILFDRVVRKDLREIWGREDTEFTPWLAQPENLELLAEVLRLDSLTLEATEQSVGRFYADIVARDGTSGLVLIENQIEQTDHKHLGQILTYLAGIDDAATVVWIAKRFQEEHRAAIDWLNANTIERFQFFGIEVEILQIGTSALAPNFDLVAKPNSWSRTVRRIETVPETPLGQQYFEYWTAFHDYLRRHENLGRLPSPLARHLSSFGIGKANFYLNVAIQREYNRILVELLPVDPSKAVFKTLYAQREEIDEEIGATLSWDELPGRKSSRIAIYRENTDIADKNGWEDQFRWYADRIKDFRRVFTPRIRAIDLENPAAEEE
jgi:hypothetical protein